MPLIECPDCGRRVSDAASACPDCARTAAARPQSDKAKVDEKPRGSVPTPIAPHAMSSVRQALELARASVVDGATARVCGECGGDVSRDNFRVKRGDAYVCMDCQDDEEDRARMRHARWRAVRLAAFALCLIVGLTTFVVHLVATAPPSAPRSTNKR